MNLFGCGVRLTALEAPSGRKILPRPIVPRGFPVRRSLPRPPIRNILTETHCRHFARNALGDFHEKTIFSAPHDAAPAEITLRKLEPAQTAF
jgi:hypothetical protein